MSSDLPLSKLYLRYGLKLSIENSVLRNNRALYGGAIATTNVQVNISRSELTENLAEWGGAISVDGNSEINYTSRRAGDIDPPATIVVTNTTIAKNRAFFGGGALYLDGWSQGAHFTLSTIVDNYAGLGGAPGQGGAVFSKATGRGSTVPSSVLLQHTILDNNKKYIRGDGFVLNDFDFAASIKLIARNSLIRADGGYSYTEDKNNLKGLEAQLSEYTQYGIANAQPAFKGLPKGYFMGAYFPLSGSRVTARPRSTWASRDFDQLWQKESVDLNGGADIGAIQHQITPGTIEIVKIPQIFSENENEIKIPVQRVDGFVGMVTVDCQIGGAKDTARVGADYLAMPTTITWKDNEGGIRYCPVRLMDNKSRENTRYFTLLGFKFEVQLRLED